MYADYYLNNYYKKSSCDSIIIVWKAFTHVLIKFSFFS